MYVRSKSTPFRNHNGSARSTNISLTCHQISHRIHSAKHTPTLETATLFTSHQTMHQTLHRAQAQPWAQHMAQHRDLAPALFRRARHRRFRLDVRAARRNRLFSPLRVLTLSTFTHKPLLETPHYGVGVRLYTLYSAAVSVPSRSTALPPPASVYSFTVS